MRKKIIMVAHFGNFDKKAVDGGQSSARRFLDTLKKMGYQVDIVNRRSKNSGGKTVAKLYAAFWGVIATIQYLSKLLRGKRVDTFTLSICYCGTMMAFDRLSTMLPKALGYKHVMYIKGGRNKPQYVNGSKRYKQWFADAIKASEIILTEAEENVKLCNSICDTTAIHLPNYVEDGFKPETLPHKPQDRCNIIYFGRLCPEKNVNLIIKAFNIISEKVNGAYLTLVGKGSEDYISSLKTEISQSNQPEHISLLPVMGHDELKECLRLQHFFIFPSCEPNEGHSNSLNEAMSWGVVPVVSTNNFLPSIVGDNRLVADKSNDAESYAKIIFEIIDSNTFDNYSKQVFDRIKNNFTQPVVEQRLSSSLNIL